MWFISAEKIKDITTIAIISAICLLMSPTVLGQWESRDNPDRQIGNNDVFSYAINYSESDNITETGGKLGATQMSYIFVSDSASATRVENIPEEVRKEIAVQKDNYVTESAAFIDYSDLDRNKIIFEDDKNRIHNTSKIMPNSLEEPPAPTNMQGRKVSKKIADSETPLAAIRLDIADYRDFKKIKEMNFRNLMKKYERHINFYNDDRTTMNMILEMLNKDI